MYILLQNYWLLYNYLKLVDISHGSISEEASDVFLPVITARESRKAVAAYLKSKQLLRSGFLRQHRSPCFQEFPRTTWITHHNAVQIYLMIAKKVSCKAECGDHVIHLIG